MTATGACGRHTPRDDLPTVCVCNAVETLHGIAERAGSPDAAEEILAECFAQQDQSLFWGPDRKLLITSRPIRELAWQTRFLGLPDVVNLSPAVDSGFLFADLMGDDRLLASLLDHIGPGRRFRLIPHTTTPGLWAFVDLLRTKYGVIAELPESCCEQELRDYLDTKSGLRSLVTEAGLSRPSCRVAQGTHCADREGARTAVVRLLRTGTPCIVKADKGEASVGLLIFRPGDDEDAVAQALAESTFYGSDPIVVEEFIEGENTVFPSVEYVVFEDPADEPVLTHVCEMLFDGATRLRGNVTSRSLSGAAWYAPFVEGSRAVAGELWRRGYRGHFGIDAVARGGEVFMLDLNARRTGSTHVHDFAVRHFGPDYLRHRTVGNYDFYGLPEDSTLTEVLHRLGALVRSPGRADSGVVPCELTGLATGRLSCLVYAPSLTAFHDLTQQVHDTLQRG
ncbi:ATP-grasp domain-containing protein [Streptomyces chattanoogensis]|uniref:ATP-grasp domain-containing protein n=1 Tax=Streptomyces chattanoogensis TaxID=66876 RepID=UPI003697D39D